MALVAISLSVAGHLLALGIMPLSFRTANSPGEAVALLIGYGPTGEAAASAHQPIGNSMESKPLARRRALRALAEGARPTLALLADVTGLSVRSLIVEARREGWALDKEPGQDVAARLRALTGGMLDRMEALRIAALQEGGRIDKQEIEAMLALIRGVEKIEEIMRPQEAAKNNQVKKDEDLADTLDRINERIVQLAKEIAAEMVANTGRPAGGEAGGR